MKNSRFLNPKIALLMILIAFLFQPIIPVSATEFSQTAYIADKTIPATVLVYSILEYSARVYIPWNTGTEEYEVNSYLAAMGSGFFVNPNGYIITNGHVVFCYESGNYKDDMVTKSYIIQDATTLLIEYVQQQYGITFTQEEIQYIMEFNAEYGEVEDSYRSVYIILGEATGNIIEAKQGYTATVVAAEPFLGRDLALLKVELSNTPALLILESLDDVSIGEQVYALGYPAVATFHPQLSESTQLVPSFTQGVVSAKRLTLQDISAIQHDADITHGNSGGPLVNSEGKVIGVNNMGSITELGLEVAGFNFAIACSVVRDFLAENGVQNYVGEATTEYEDGLAYYYAKLYSTAKQKFQAVTAVFPYHWKAQQLIQECQSKILKGEKAESRISITLNLAEVKVNEEQIRVSGTLTHSSEMPIPIEIQWADIQVTIEYVKPDGTKITRTATVNADGTFEDSITPDQAGVWTVTAYWSGNEDYSETTSNQASFTAREPPITWNIYLYAMIVVPIVASIIIVLLFMTRRKMHRS